MTFLFVLLTTFTFAGEIITPREGDDDDMFVRRSAKEIPVKVQRANHVGNSANAVVAITRPDSDDLNLVVYLMKNQMTYEMLGPLKVCDASEKEPKLSKLEIKKQISVTCSWEGKSDQLKVYRITDKIELIP